MAVSLIGHLFTTFKKVRGLQFVFVSDEFGMKLRVVIKQIKSVLIWDLISEKSFN